MANETGSGKIIGKLKCLVLHFISLKMIHPGSVSKLL